MLDLRHSLYSDVVEDLGRDDVGFCNQPLVVEPTIEVISDTESFVSPSFVISGVD